MMNRTPLARLLCIFMSSFALLASASAQVVVTSLADSGAGSLRQAVLDASSGDTITFTNTLSGQTILLISGQLLLDKSLSVDASSLADSIILSGNHASRIFEVGQAPRTASTHSP